MFFGQRTKGKAYCARCNAYGDFTCKWFKGADWIECNTCHERFPARAPLDPNWWTALIRQQFTAAILSVLLKVVMSKGHYLPFEIRRKLQLAYQNICGELLAESTLQKGLQAGVYIKSMQELVSNIRMSIPRGMRKRIVKEATRAADIEGTITENQRLLIRELKRALRGW